MEVLHKTKSSASRPPWRYLSVLAMYCLLVLARAPQILINGRIWAEDAHAFQAAVDRSFLSMMAWVHWAGYRIAYQSFAAYAAVHWVPLDCAPYVFIFLGLVLQALPLCLLMLVRTELKLSLQWFSIAALGFLLTNPNYDLWLTTVTAGFLLSASVSLVLISPIPVGPRKWLHRAVLVIAASSGIPSLFLVPFFLWRCFKEREKERIVQTALLCLAGAVQLSALVQSGTGGRKYLFSTGGVLAAIMTNDLLLPFIGHNLLLNLDPFVEGLRSQISGVLAPRNWAILVFSVGTFVGVLRLLSRRTESAYLFAGALLMSVLSIIGNLGGVDVISLGTDSRYFYVPNVLIFLGVILAVHRDTGLPAVARYMVLCSMVWVLGVGAVEYFHFPAYFYEVPAWKEQVATWRKQPWRSIRTAPMILGLEVHPSSGNILIAPDILPVNESYTSPVSLSMAKQVVQRFRAGRDGLYTIEVMVVTWGRPEPSRAYWVDWELREMDGGGILRSGKLDARAARDWGWMPIDLSGIVGRSEKWYELLFRAPAGVGEDQAIGLPMYNLTPGDSRLMPVTISGVELGAPQSIRLSLHYGSIQK